MRKWTKITLYVGAFFALNTVCKNLTDDFSTDHLISPSSANSKWAQKKEPSDLKKVLKQKYTYLGRGKQAYVFASEDQEHVLKVFKPHIPYIHYKLFGRPCKLGLSKIPFAKTLLEKIYKEQVESKREEEFQSYVNSFNLLQKETKLEYLHLAKTEHLQHKLQIYDKIGVLRELDLDNTCFLIQKKTDMLYPSLATLIKRGEMQKAKEMLESFVDLSFQFILQGIDNPTTIEKNFGCVGLSPVQIDVGRVLIREDFATTGPNLGQIHHSVHHMKKWLGPKSKELQNHLDKIVEAKKTIHLKELHEVSL